AEAAEHGDVVAMRVQPLQRRGIAAHHLGVGELRQRHRLVPGLVGQAVTLQRPYVARRNAAGNDRPGADSRGARQCASYGAAAGSTTIVPTIPKPQCGMQKYGNVPAVLKVWL